MEHTNYIFKGIGHAAGKFVVENVQLEQAAGQGMLSGFYPDIVKQSKNYQKFKASYPNATPFDYFVGHKMGFHKRHHVTPWPPRDDNQAKAENALDLAVEAIEHALDDACINAEEVDGWIVSTVSPHEQAPGIATTIKSYFTVPDNQASAMTLTSGCAGFNKSLRRALDHFKGNPSLNNIVIVHTETMSHFLNRQKDFVFHATFGDAAAAIVVSRQKSEEKEGVIAISNHQDPKMIDFVGVDKQWGLYMNSGMVKQRAVPDLIKSTLEVAGKSEWTMDDIDLVVPHQTGNAILHSVAEELRLPLEKMYQEAQHEYGNVSGTTIPIALSMLNQQDKLRPGMKILCPTAGVGGEYGAFSYIVAGRERKNTNKHNQLAGNHILVLFADNSLGMQVVHDFAENGIQVTAHLSNENDYSEAILGYASSIPGINVIEQSVASVDEAQKLLSRLKGSSFYGILNLAFARELIYGFGDPNECTSKLQLPVDTLVRGTTLLAKCKVVHVGHALALMNLSQPEPLSSAIDAIYGLTGSMSGEAISKGIQTIWYIPAIYDQLTQYMNIKNRSFCLQVMEQNEVRKNLTGISERLIKCFYLSKVRATKDQYQGPMILRKELCRFRTVK